MTDGSMWLPTDKAVLAILGVCGQREPLELREESGWLVGQWKGPRGTAGRVGVRADDAEAAAALEWVRTNPTAFAVVLALLVRLVELDGAEGAWRFERVAELLYGPRQANSHRERQLEGVHAWMVLLERGRWDLDGVAKPKAPKPTKRRRRAAAAPPTYGAHLTGQLLVVERKNRAAATVRLAPAFAAALKQAGTLVPIDTFRLTQEGHSNPEGNHPRLAVRARARLAMAIAARWREANGQGVRLRELLEEWAGLDLAPMHRRRRSACWFDTIQGELRRVYELGGAGLAAVVHAERRVLDTVLRFATRGDDRERRVARSRRAPATGPPSATKPA
jgi:hypothetical protein